jgi:hypothetical protein
MCCQAPGRTATYMQRLELTKLYFTLVHAYGVWIDGLQSKNTRKFGRYLPDG